MENRPDFKELLELFNARKIEYVIVGAFALAHYGSPRLTGDLDILVQPDTENAKRIVSALFDFGFGSLGYSIADFDKPDSIVQLGVAPGRIDILTSITAVSWVEVQRGRDAGKFDDLDTWFIGKQEFIANKRATGRIKDLADLEAIGIRK